MTIIELANELKKIYDQRGDIEVFFAGPNLDQDPYSVEEVTFRVAEEHEFNPVFSMPKGYKFVMLEA